MRSGGGERLGDGDPLTMTPGKPDPSPSRREVLAAAAAVSGLGLVAGASGVGCVGSPDFGPGPRAPSDLPYSDSTGSASRSSPQTERDEDLLDEALQRVDERLPDQNFHRSNHVPMVAEALCVLGRADAIRGWVDENLEEHRPGPAARTRIDASEWRSAIAQSSRSRL